MADGRYVENVGNAITRLPMDRLGRSLGGRIASCPRHTRHHAVPMVTAVRLPSNSTLNIHQSWASGG